MVRYAAKTDENQAEIVRALRTAGCSVLILSRVGQGCPDLLVARDGRNVLLEVKRPGKKLNDEQRDFVLAWRGEMHKVETAVEAVGVMLR